MLLTFLTIGFSPSDLVVSIEIVQAVPLFTIFLPMLIIFSATSNRYTSFPGLSHLFQHAELYGMVFSPIVVSGNTPFFCVSTRERMGLYCFCP